MEADFRGLFSQVHGYPPEQFEERMFARTLFRHAIPFSWFIRNRHKFFREDLEMLRDIATARSTPEVISELNRFFGRNHRDKNFFRTSFFIRVSGKRVLRIYRELIQRRPASQSAALGEPELQPQH